MPRGMSWAYVNHYQVNELQAADRTLQQVIQFYIEKARKQGILPAGKTARPSVNIIGLTTLGFPTTTTSENCAP